MSPAELATRIETIPKPVPPATNRWVTLDGARNVRDIGGYRTSDGRTVRWNLVYRSDELCRLTDAGCEAFRGLKIRTVIDFRDRLAPSPLFGGDADCVFEAANVVGLPIRARDANPALPAYVRSVQGNADSYRQLFELIADPDSLPLLYHCAAGKDRTGVATVLILTLLGVNREVVMEDYERSAEVVPPVEPQDVTDLLKAIDASGGIRPFLSGVGVSTETQDAIRLILLE